LRNHYRYIYKFFVDEVLQNIPLAAVVNDTVIHLVNNRLLEALAIRVWALIMEN
jgi:hypothetical protein